MLLDLPRKLRQNGIIDYGNGITFGKWLQNGSAKRFGVVESSCHVLHIVPLARDEAMEEQKYALGIVALYKDDRLVGLSEGRELFFVRLASMNLSS